MKVLIVGGGIGGLSLAGFLQQAGIDCTLIEKHPTWEHEGYSLGLWSNGRTMLNKLGLEEEFDKASVPFQKFVVYDQAGKALRTYKLSKFITEFGMGYEHIKRAKLHELLLRNVDANKIQSGISLVSITENRDGVDVVFTDGSKSTFDLLVGADGIHSQVRELCFAQHIEKYTNWRLWYFWTQRAAAAIRTVSQYPAPNEFATIFDDGDRALVVMITKIKHEVWDDVQDRLSRLKILLQKEPAVSQALLDGIRAEDILPTDLIEIELKRWHTNRLVLIGDAAHGFEPFAGLGGSMAMEDAYVLASELMKSQENIAQALELFETRRRPRVKKAKHLTRRMQGWATIESPMLRKIVNAAIPYIPERFLTAGYLDLLRLSA